MRNMKFGFALGVCLLLIPAWALALTYTTLNTSDGVVESDPPVLGGTTWETDELMDTDGGTNFYFTWDDTTFYCAITGTYADQQDGDYDWFIAFDLDQIPGSGAPGDGYLSVTFPGDFRPEIIYYFTHGMGEYESSEWDGAAWVWRGWQTDCSYGGWDGNFTSELCIPDSMLAYAESLAVLSWITNEDHNQIVASFPSGNPIGPATQGMIHAWVAKDLGENIAPNELPIQPPPPAALVDNERSFEFTCTAMADITPGNCGSTTQMTFYYTVGGGVPDSNSSFVVGTYDACSIGADTSDTFYGIIPAPDDSLVTWIAKGMAKNALIDWSDTTFTFTQGGTAWIGNQGSSPTTCTVWAEIYVGDDGQTTYIKFPYTSDGSDPRVSATVDTADGTFDGKVGNNDKYYAELTDPALDDTVWWYAFGEDANDNYAETDDIYMFIQGDTAELYNLTCVPDSDYVLVTGEVEPPGFGAGMDFYWTLDGSDPKDEGTAYKASGFHIENTESTGKFGAWLAADLGDTINWYVHAWDSLNAFSDSRNQQCVAEVDSRPTICNLRCVPDSAIVRASLSPRGYGSEIGFYVTVNGGDPMTDPNVAVFIEGNYLTEVDTPGGDCVDPVGVFERALPGSIAAGDTIKWYAYAYYREGNQYNGLFGYSAMQTCVADTTMAGVEPKDARPLVPRITNVPNPFDGSTDIMFQLSRKAGVSILVYDIRGRMVDSVLEAILPQGQHSVTWSGRSEAGEALPSGIYFFRFRAGSFETTKKAILIR